MSRIGGNVCSDKIRTAAGNSVILVACNHAMSRAEQSRAKQIFIEKVSLGLSWLMEERVTVLS